MPEKPNCYACQYRRDLPGDAHSRCVHPAIGPQEDNPIAALVGALAQARRMDGGTVGGAARELHVSGHPHGIKRGWFLWPVNFDPTWLLTCDGFTPKGGDRG